MAPIRNALKIAGFNAALTICLLGLLVMAPALWSDLKQALEGEGNAADSQEYLLPPYRNEPWAKQHFFEFARLETQYHDFIGWRRTPFSGETITVDRNGFRRHTSNANDPNDAAIWVFGGSTVWGTGSPDNGTIPAQLETLTNRGTFNFGESGYVSHQSLNLLMRQYVLGGKPELVIFYDGVNEVAHKCRRELTFYSASREQQIRERLQIRGGSRFLKLFQPLVDGLRVRLPNTAKTSSRNDPRYFDCDTDTEKATLIAKNLIQDWNVARRLVEGHGGRFLPVLQPVSYIGAPNLEYLPKSTRDAALELQFQAVYPKIREQAKKLELTFLDLTSLFDGPVPRYIDFCHVTPEGNKEIALAINELL
jgi:hypothetical protein